MKTIVMHPTPAAQWHALISEAEKACALTLGEELESYLVFLLQRFIQRPDMITSIIALEFLQSMHELDKKRKEILRDVGDKCLLLAGLFPERAERRNIRLSYFVELGQTAYAVLSEIDGKEVAELFYALYKSFVVLMDVLQITRELDGKHSALLPIQAIELWEDTGSQHALKVLQNYTKGILTPLTAARRERQ